MDYQVTRQAVISSNIANQDTPGYKAKDISFSEELKSRLALSTTHPEHRQKDKGGLDFKEFVDPYQRIGNDGNTVDLDREMHKLAQNNILYSAATDRVRAKFESLLTLIRSIK